LAEGVGVDFVFKQGALLVIEAQLHDIGDDGVIFVGHEIPRMGTRGASPAAK
jgi:hypothetical protein